MVYLEFPKRNREEGNRLLSYDDQNIFAKILKGEIAATKIFEDKFALAFHDINPQTPVHVLIIPKGRYISYADFCETASDAELVGFMRALGFVARKMGVTTSGSRILSNQGIDGHQEVPHFHLHLFAGINLGRMIKPIEANVNSGS